MKFSIKAFHAGQQPDETTGSVIIPVYLTSTYRQEELDVSHLFAEYISFAGKYQKGLHKQRKRKSEQKK